MNYTTSNKPTYEKVRTIPAKEMLMLNKFTLDYLEREIREEIRRAKLSLRWVKGTKEVKKEEQKNG